MKAHPIADVYPKIAGPKFQELVESIKKNGLLHPIVLLDDVILDGRSRWDACKEATVEPRTKQYVGRKDFASLVRYVRAVNEHRRHLTISQLSVIAST